MSFEVVQRGRDVLLKIGGVGYPKLHGTGKEAIQAFVGDLQKSERTINVGGVRLYLNEDKSTSLRSACEKAIEDYDETLEPIEDETPQVGFYDSDENSDDNDE